MRTPQEDSPSPGQSHNDQHYVGHTHFWERALLSRRQFMLTAAGATGVVLSSGLWMPGLTLAQGDGAAPKPIPEGFTAFGKFFHLDPASPGPVVENSAIFDFHGFIGVAALGGTGTGIDTSTGQQHPLLFDVDMRFMQGVYIGVDGQQHTGTFGFI